jgi:hypothetical protein
MYMPLRKIMLIVALSFSIEAFGQDAGPISTGPSISSATANFAVSPPQLTIVGHNFGSVQPTVTLGGTSLTVISSSSSNVVADLPQALVLGASYTLTVTNNQSFLKPKATLDLTLGLAGPQPPQNHAYSAYCGSCTFGTSLTAVVSLPVPAGAYVISAKAIGDTVNGVSQPFSGTCYLTVQSSSTVLDTSLTTTGSPYTPVTIVNLAAVTLAAPDTILFQCQSGISVSEAVENAQLIATQVGGLN